MNTIEEQIKTITISNNGKTTVVPTEVEGEISSLSEVQITVNVETPNSRTLTVTENGQYDPEEGVMYSSVDVNVPSDPAELQAKYDEGKADGKSEDYDAVNTWNQRILQLLRVVTIQFQ